MLEIVDSSYKDSPEALPHQDDDNAVENKKSTAEVDGNKAPEGQKAADADADADVQSPPRRSPAPSAVSGKVGWLPRPLEEVMKNWVQRPGYPIVNVYRNLETGVVTLSQVRRSSATSDAASNSCPRATATATTPLQAYYRGNFKSNALTLTQIWEINAGTLISAISAMNVKLSISKINLRREKATNLRNLHVTCPVDCPTVNVNH